MRQAVWPHKLTIDRGSHAKADSYKREMITAGDERGRRYPMEH